MTHPVAPFLAGLHIYPIKSCAGVALTRAHLDARGLTLDRRWMLVDPQGEAVTLRQCPALARAQPALESGGLSVRAVGLPELKLPLESDGPPLSVTLFGQPIAALACPEGDGWFSQLAGRPLRLVRQAPDSNRGLSGNFGGQALALQDGNPVHLIGRASVDALAAQTGTALPLARFRANLLIEGAPAWAEDSWARVRLGGVTFTLYEPTQRCAIVNVPSGGEPGGREPLATLARTRRTPLGVLFGWNLGHAAGGELSVGDPLEVLEVRPSPFAGEPSH